MAAAPTRLLARGMKKDRMFHPDWRWRAELFGPEVYREDNREIRETRVWVCVSGLPLPISILDAGAIWIHILKGKLKTEGFSTLLPVWNSGRRKVCAVTLVNGDRPCKCPHGIVVQGQNPS